MFATKTKALPVQVALLSKHYGALRAVDEVSFDVAPGEFLTLLGPSGSGKTTLLMMIAGFTRPTAGSIRLGGQEIVYLPPHKRDIGMVFQNYALFPHMNVFENIAYPLRLRGVGRSECAERVRHVLDLVQLPGHEERRVSELSGGQRQRIALARAIVFEPRILLMDEPLSALDKQLRETMQIEIRRLHDRLGTTTISVTHDQREALTMSDRIAVFCDGRLEQIAEPQKLYDKPQNRFVAEFIGESNFVPVDRVRGGLRYGETMLKLADDADSAIPSPTLMLRPEQILLSYEGEHWDADAWNILPGTVSEVVFQGESLFLEVQLAGGDPVHVRLPNRAVNANRRPRKGQAVKLLLHRSDTRILPLDASR